MASLIPIKNAKQTRPKNCFEMKPAKFTSTLYYEALSYYLRRWKGLPHLQAGADSMILPESSSELFEIRTIYRQALVWRKNIHCSLFASSISVVCCGFNVSRFSNDWTKKCVLLKLCTCIYGNQFVVLISVCNMGALWRWERWAGVYLENYTQLHLENWCQHFQKKNQK